MRKGASLILPKSEVIQLHKIFADIICNNKYPQNLSTTFKFLKQNFEIITIKSFLANLPMLYGFLMFPKTVF